MTDVSCQHKAIKILYEAKVDQLKFPKNLTKTKVRILNMHFSGKVKQDEDKN